MSDEPVQNPHLETIAGKLAVVVRLVDGITREVGPGTVRGADAIIERHRPEVYAAVEAVGQAVHELVQSGPPPEQLAAAQALVISQLRTISQTSPISLYGSQGKRQRVSYFEIVRHVRAGGLAGADVPARVLDDYFIHTHIGRAFANRLALLNQRLIDNAVRCRAAGNEPVRVLSLQYVGGDELLMLAQRMGGLDGIQVTCVDSNPAAIRHAEQTLRPAFNQRIEIRMADPVRWLQGPTYPKGSACIAYAVSLLEQLPLRRVVQVLTGVHSALRPGGMLIMGSTAGSPPPGEQVLRDLLLGWDWKYRSEDDWRELFAQTPFGSEGLVFEYEPLRINALIHAEKGQGAT